MGRATFDDLRDLRHLDRTRRREQGGRTRTSNVAVFRYQTASLTSDPRPQPVYGDVYLADFWRRLERLCLTFSNCRHYSYRQAASSYRTLFSPWVAERRHRPGRLFRNAFDLTVSNSYDLVSWWCVSLESSRKNRAIAFGSRPSPLRVSCPVERHAPAFGYSSRDSVTVAPRSRHRGQVSKLPRSPPSQIARPQPR